MNQQQPGAIDLDKLAEILARETAVIDPDDVADLMRVIRNEATTTEPTATLSGARVSLTVDDGGALCVAVNVDDAERSLRDQSGNVPVRIGIEGRYVDLYEVEQAQAARENSGDPVRMSENAGPWYTVTRPGRAGLDGEYSARKIAEMRCDGLIDADAIVTMVSAGQPDPDAGHTTFYRVSWAQYGEYASVLSAATLADITGQTVAEVIEDGPDTVALCDGLGEIDYAYRDNPVFERQQITADEIDADVIAG